MESNILDQIPIKKYFLYKDYIYFFHDKKYTSQYDNHIYFTVKNYMIIDTKELRQTFYDDGNTFLFSFSEIENMKILSKNQMEKIQDILKQKIYLVLELQKIIDKKKKTKKAKPYEIEII